MWAFVFPGQGSQHQGMGQFLYNDFKSVKLLFEEGSEALKVDLKKLLFEAPESELALTENTQPALLLVSEASRKVLSETTSIRAVATSGHSVGEYSALCAAGVFSFTDALKSVRARGQAMQRAVPVGEGAMAAVMGLTPTQVKKLCEWAESKTSQSPLEPANYNAPGQIVISGSKKLLDWTIENFSVEVFSEIFSNDEKIGRVKFIPLKVSAPFHCSLMKSAEDEMCEVLNTVVFSEAKFPVVQNLTASAETKPEIIKRNLIKQITGPVRWIECVENLKNIGAKKMIEVGSGKVLSGLIKKIDPDTFEVFNLNSLEDLKKLESL